MTDFFKRDDFRPYRMVPVAINDNFDSLLLKELNFTPPEYSENYDDPLLPLVKFIVNCNQNRAITSRYALNRGSFSAFTEWVML